MVKLEKDWDVSLGYADPKVDELLNHSIRLQLESLLKPKLTVEQRRWLLQQSFEEAISLILTDTKTTHQQLVKAFENMYDQAVLSMAQAKLSQEVLTREYISPTGLIMSPYHCKHTIKDVYRIKGYARGIDQAIQGKLKHKPTITILYPACGPFAPLLLPLITYYKNNEIFSARQLQVMLVDVQPGAVMTLRQLVKDLQLEEYISLIEEVDATQFVPQVGVDLLVLEAMQHGFTKEGQLSIAKHLVQFLNIDGWMIPQKVSIRGMMVIGETEFNQQWKDADFSHSQHLANIALQDRIELGEIFNISKSSLLSMQVLELENGARVIPANQVALPKNVPDMGKRIFALYALIETFAKETIGQYDSGITHPLPDMSICVDFKPSASEPDDLLVKSGDTLQFYYKLCGMPSFVPTIV